MKRTSRDLLLLLVGIAACSESEHDLTSGQQILSRSAQQIVHMRLSPSNRPAGAAVPSQWSFPEPFQLVRTASGISEYHSPLPARVLFYGSTNRKSPPDMALLDSDGIEWEFEARVDRMGAPGTWSYAGGEIYIRVRDHEAIPPLQLRLPQATEDEMRLNLEASGLTASDFALGSLPAAKAWRQGLLLPAPSSVRFRVQVPRDGHLSFHAQLLAPPVDNGISSDGSTVIVETTGSRGELELGRQFLLSGDAQAVTLDLSPHQGTEIELQIRTDPGENKSLDYVLIGEPVLYTPKKNPRRVLLVFIDTLRPDRMGLYGHSRDTTPVLDELAATSVVFDQARAPSSWTLPSGRSSISGRQPERWDAGPHLGQILGDAGWATVAVVTNSYMTEPFGMVEGWGVHQSNMGIRADQEVLRALQWISDYRDRDLMLWLHLIDPHLPYTEAVEFRSIWAQEIPEQLEGPINAKTVAAAWTACETDAERQELSDYLWDRYDQNIRAADAALEPILEAMGPDSLVVVYSDHGEEFWEHGVMGHGHSLSEEQLRVPLIVRAPALAPARVAAPVNLIDIAPTVLELLDIQPPAGEARMDGQSLVAAAQGRREALDALEHRPQAFGRTLSGEDSWGVLVDSHKWTSSGYVETLFDLDLDPTEDHNLLAGEEHNTDPYIEALSSVLSRPVGRVWRASIPDQDRSIETPSTQLWLRHPEGFSEFWTPWDPMSKRTDPIQVQERVGLLGDALRRSPQELFVSPAVSPVDIQLSLQIGAEQWTDTITEAHVEAWRSGGPLLELGPPDHPAHFGWTVQPSPIPLSGVTLGSDVETNLAAMGYLE